MSDGGRRVPASRLGRIALLGRLVGGVAGGMVAEGARRLARGERPAMSELMLTPGNAQRLSDRFAELRGAAMKVGQLLSMDPGHLLPPEFAELLARLREQARPLPLGEVNRVLEVAWGADWVRGFERFSFTPLAAASIGQVHEGYARDGRRLAIKLQYPGVRRSIDSDVDNVATLLRVFALLPRGLELDPLLADAKQQLHREADYRHEAGSLRRYSALVADDARFVTPELDEARSTPEVLAMSFLEGRTIDTLVDAPLAVRNVAGQALLELALRELFDWGLVQTDPNFANFLHHRGRIQLLDFGAMRGYDLSTRAQLRQLLLACLAEDRAGVSAAAAAVGYISPEDPPEYCGGIVDLLWIASEPARCRGRYRFGDVDLARRMRDRVIRMRVTQGYTRIPPPPLLFLHRKLGGLYLLLCRLGCELPVREICAAQAGVKPVPAGPLSGGTA